MRFQMRATAPLGTELEVVHNILWQGIGLHDYTIS